MSKCGFSFVRTLEVDERCCETLRRNREYLGIVEEDLQPVDITKTPPESFAADQVDYIVGGPPCQSFSAAGRRAGGVAGTGDDRGVLFEEYCKYVKHFRPKAFVFENVRGILSSNKGADFEIICDAFQKTGYKLFSRVLNAADYGVPQHRERVFLVGIRDDLDIAFRFPLPTHGPDSPDGVPYVTIREALAPVIDENEVTAPYGGKYGDLIPDIPPGENYRYYTEEMGHPQPLFGWRSKFSNFLYKMDPDDLCRTIIAYQGKYDGPFHWNNRKCTVDELKLLQGYPLDYAIPHSYNTAVKQIGNSVCPPVAFQLGKALRWQVEGIPEMEVPLIPNGQPLTVDRRKRARAKASREKIAVRYADIMQMSLYGEAAPAKYADPFVKTHILDGAKAHWKYEEGGLRIDLYGNSPREPVHTELSLRLLGGVTVNLQSIAACIREPVPVEKGLPLLWNEIHRGVGELTSYDSLMPLYGHFTEPYPKFEISFRSQQDGPVVRFQQLAIRDDLLSRITPYPLLELGQGWSETESHVLSMRTLGYDVRTHKTNPTIPDEHVMICYPFTLPQK